MSRYAIEPGDIYLEKPGSGLHRTDLDSSAARESTRDHRGIATNVCCETTAAKPTTASSRWFPL